jgi:hypothetical protein
VVSTFSQREINVSGTQRQHRRHAKFHAPAVWWSPGAGDSTSASGTFQHAFLVAFHVRFGCLPARVSGRIPRPFRVPPSARLWSHSTSVPGAFQHAFPGAFHARFGCLPARVHGRIPRPFWVPPSTRFWSHSTSVLGTSPHVFLPPNRGRISSRIGSPSASENVQFSACRRVPSAGAFRALNRHVFGGAEGASGGGPTGVGCGVRRRPFTKR